MFNICLFKGKYFPFQITLFGHFLVTHTMFCTHDFSYHMFPFKLYTTAPDQEYADTYFGLNWFLGFGCIVTIKGNITATTCSDILNNRVLASLRLEFREVSFHLIIPCALTSLSSQIPDLNPIQHVWEHQLQGRFYT